MRRKALLSAIPLLAAGGLLGSTQPLAAQTPQAPVVRSESGDGSQAAPAAPGAGTSVPSGLPSTIEQPAPAEPPSRPRWTLWRRLFHWKDQAPAASALPPETATSNHPVTPAAVTPVQAAGGVTPVSGRLTPVSNSAGDPAISEAALQPGRLQTRVRAACGARSGDVTVKRQADKTLLVTVRLPNSRAQEETLKKIMQLPEMASPQVRLVVEVQP